jgi:hypothetical protein
MKKAFLVFFLILALPFNLSYGQVSLGISGLAPNDAKEYTKPLATFFGTYFNSGSYYSADLPETFQFKFSIIGMYTFTTDGQKTFTPNPGVDGYNVSGTTSTFIGEEGNYYIGPGGFLAYPGGFNVGSVGAGIYQAAGSLMGTELMVRFFPSVEISDIEAGLWGIGLKHEISRWIPGLPFDLALQILYNSFSLEYKGTNIEDYFKIDSKNFAVNAHASKTFSGLFVVYGGLQYENSTMDLGYYFRDPNDLYPLIKNTQQNTTVDGDNVFRFTAGGAVKLLPVVFNLDFNVTSMFTIAGGISLQF